MYEWLSEIADAFLPYAAARRFTPENIARFLLAWILSFSAGFFGAMSLQTAYDLPMTMFFIGLFSAYLSLLFTCAFLLKKKCWFLLPFVFPMVIYFRESWPDLRDGAILAASMFYSHLASADYFFRNMNLVFEHVDIKTCTVFLQAASLPLSFTMAYCCLRKGRSLPNFIVAVPYFAVCLILNNRTPAPWALLGLIASLTACFLTRTARKSSDAFAWRTCLKTTALTVLVFAVPMTLLRPLEYHRSKWAIELHDSLQAFSRRHAIFYTHGEAEGVPAVEFIPPFSRRTLGFDDWNEDLSVSDLRNVGPNPESYRSIMRVYSDFEGVEYLKGAAYAYFDDNVWRMATDSDFEGVDLTVDYLIPVPYDFMGRPFTDNYTVEIHTTRHGGIYYVPYTAMTDEMEFMHADDAYYDNVDYETIYRFAANPYMLKRHTGAGYREAANRVYLGLSEELQELYQPIIREIGEQYLQDLVDDVGVNEILAQRIAVYLQTKSAYSRLTSAVPEGRDLADWFINDSETGYCVHFATAAALLLRMYGIPTRYVTGYRVTTRAGMYVDVLEKDAHAWVEWLDPISMTWNILDPTPASALTAEETEEPEYTPPPVDEQQETPPPDAEVTPEPGDPGPPAEETAFVLPGWLAVLAKVVLVYGLYRLLALLALKAYLTDKDRRKQVIRCYHYYMYITGLFWQPRQERATIIAEKAKFSRDGVTEKEKNEMLRMVRKTYTDRLRYEKLIYLIIGL